MNPLNCLLFFEETFFEILSMIISLNFCKKNQIHSFQLWTTDLSHLKSFYEKLFSFLSLKVFQGFRILLFPLYSTSFNIMWNKTYKIWPLIFLCNTWKTFSEWKFIFILSFLLLFFFFRSSFGKFLIMTRITVTNFMNDYVKLSLSVS